jgi:hypothetical protein
LVHADIDDDDAGFLSMLFLLFPSLVVAVDEATTLEASVVVEEIVVEVNSTAVDELMAGCCCFDVIPSRTFESVSNLYEHEYDKHITE